MHDSTILATPRQLLLAQCAEQNSQTCCVQKSRVTDLARQPMVLAKPSLEPERLTARGRTSTTMTVTSSRSPRAFKDISTSSAAADFASTTRTFNIACSPPRRTITVVVNVPQTKNKQPRCACAKTLLSFLPARRLRGHPIGRPRPARSVPQSEERAEAGTPVRHGGTDGDRVNLQTDLHPTTTAFLSQPQTARTSGMERISGPTSTSPIVRDMARPPGQARKGPTCFCRTGCHSFRSACPADFSRCTWWPQTQRRSKHNISVTRASTRYTNRRQASKQH